MRTRRISALFAVGFLLVFGKNTAKAEEGPNTSATGASYLEVDTENVFYGFNKVHLSYEDKSNLNRYVDWVKSDPSITLKVEARTDDIGSNLVNLRVSQRRANIVAEYLINKGVPADKIQAVGLGEENPLFDNVNSENRRLNRRTTIKVIRKVVQFTPAKSVSTPAAPSGLENFDLPSASPVTHTTKTIVEASKKEVKPQPVAATSAPERKRIVTKVMNPVLSQEKVEEVKPIVEARKQPIVEARESFTTIPSDVPRVIPRKESAPKPVVKVEAPIPRVVEAPKPIVKEEVKPVVKTRVVENTKPAPVVVETKEEATEVKVIKNSRTIKFIDAETGQPVKAEIDLKTISGKKSFDADNSGAISVSVNELRTGKAEIYAYGYFYKTEEVQKLSGTQIISLTPIAKGSKFEVENILFRPGTPTLMRDSKEELKKLYHFLNTNKKIKIEIGGHINVPFTKPRDVSSRQKKLSTERAKSVFDYLVEKGISRSRLKYKGYGNSEMIYPKAVKEEEQSANRRVEVKIIE